jgi:beta-glucanase (GH16 family)
MGLVGPPAPVIGKRMRLHRLLLVLLAAVAGAEEASYKLAFEENFDGSKLDEETWSTNSGIYRDGTYTDKAIGIKDGVMTITTWTEKGIFYTGAINTKSGKLSVKQGKIEARLRFTPVPGMKMMFRSNTDYLDRDQPNRVGFNIFEAFSGAKGGYLVGLSWGDPEDPDEKKGIKQSFAVTAGKFWHTYGLEWDDSGYRFTLDGKIVLTDKKAMRSITRRGINLQSDVTSKAEAPRGGYGSKEKSRNIYEVDWVKAWERVPAAK